MSVWSVVIFMLLLVILATSILYGYSQWETDYPSVMSVAVCIMGMYIASAFLIILLLDTGVETGTNYFSYLVLVIYFLLFLQMEKTILAGDDQFRIFLIITYYALNFLIALSVLILWKYLRNAVYMKEKLTEKVDIAMDILLIVDILLLVSNVFTGFIFEVDSNAEYSYGIGKWVLNTVPFTMMALIALIVTLSKDDFRRKLSVYTIMLLPMVALAIEWFIIGVSMLGISILFSLLIIYGNFYVGRSEDLARKDSELVKQRADILVSQIQPHFLYNVLTSIMNIKGNPDTTRDSISYFGKYLRGNLDILKQKGPIPIMAELDHIDNYMELVKLNFGDGLHLDIDVHDRSMMLPALTLQSVIESVIELGYGHNKPYGTMTLRIYRDSDFHYAELSDDRGIMHRCYDLAEGSIDTFGLSNVNYRLRDMVGGDIQFRSRDSDIVFLLMVPCA